MSSANFKQLIEKCTSEHLPAEDWDSMVALNDILCQRPDEVTPVVLQCILQRLSVPNPKTQLYTITLLDFCVKNSTELFNRALERGSNLSLVENLVKSPNQQVSKRAKEVIEEWAKELGQKYPAYSYANARVTMGHAGAPPPQQQQATAPIASGFHLSAPSPPSPSQPLAVPSVSKREKLRKDLDSVRDNVDLLIEMVETASSYQEIRNATMFQIVADCKEMHRRIIKLIEKIPEETVLLELIQVNDELAAAIDFYGTFKSTGKKESTPPKAFRNNAAPQSSIPQYAPEPAPRPVSSALDLFVEPSAPPPRQSGQAQPLFTIDDLLATPNTSAQPTNAPLSVATNIDAPRPFQQPPARNMHVNPLNPFDSPISAVPPMVQQQQYQQPPQSASMDPFELMINDMPSIPAPSVTNVPVAAPVANKSAEPFLLPPPKSDKARKRQLPVDPNHPSADFIDFLDQAASKSSSSVPQQEAKQTSSSTSNKQNQLFSLE